MSARNILLGVLIPTIAFVVLYVLLVQAGLSTIWVLAGAILGGLLTSRLVDRTLRRRGRR